MELESSGSKGGNLVVVKKFQETGLKTVFLHLSKPSRDRLPKVRKAIEYLREEYGSVGSMKLLFQYKKSRVTSKSRTD